jgi:hypothetical protein
MHYEQGEPLGWGRGNGEGEGGFSLLPTRDKSGREFAPRQRRDFQVGKKGFPKSGGGIPGSERGVAKKRLQVRDVGIRLYVYMC